MYFGEGLFQSIASCVIGTGILKGGLYRLNLMIGFCQAKYEESNMMSPYFVA